MDTVWIVRFSETRMIIGVWSSEELAEADVAKQLKAGRHAYVTMFHVIG